ncbi:hypothetical protein RhiirC2_799776 [Rhizophagus irregularis]|uniref:Uncharacterized protein n=1 Tax=Rhizophagus irregularis TaxID=588596 RepID=A0A2N1M4G8_9GLOM|nr:hypothetical protein RhiirC2_799776 [Rhizophagus irregularis]
MLCIRPAEIKNLRISNGGVTGYAKNRGQQDNPRVFRSLEKNEERARELLTWIQEAISSGQLRDSGKPGSTYLSAFLKKDEFIPKPYKPLLPSSLRKLGAVFAVVAHGLKNLSEANTIASQALHHSPDNHTAPSDRYTIVNFRRRGQPQDIAYRIYHENERRVKRLERDVKILDTELEILKDCADTDTVVDLIQKMIPLLVRDKSLIKNNPSSSSSESSEESDSAERIVKINGRQVRVKRAIPHALAPSAKQRRRASSESSSSESSSSSETSSSESSSSESSSLSESSLTESSSSDSDIDEIVKMIKHQRIRKQIRKRQAQRKVSENSLIGLFNASPEQ